MKSIFINEVLVEVKTRLIIRWIVKFFLALKTVKAEMSPERSKFLSALRLSLLASFMSLLYHGIKGRTLIVFVTTDAWESIAAANGVL